MEDGTGFVIFDLHLEEKLPDNLSFLWRMYLAQSTVQGQLGAVASVQATTHSTTDNLGGTVGESDKMYLTIKPITFTQEDKWPLRFALHKCNLS